MLPIVTLFRLFDISLSFPLSPSFNFLLTVYSLFSIIPVKKYNLAKNLFTIFGKNPAIEVGDLKLLKILYKPIKSQIKSGKLSLHDRKQLLSILIEYPLNVEG